MSRGFLAGAGWGIVVAGLGLVVVSQVTDIAPGNLEKVPPAVVVANAPEAPEPEAAPSASLHGSAPDPVVSVAPVESGDALANPVAEAPAAPQDVAGSLTPSEPGAAEQVAGQPTAPTQSTAPEATVPPAPIAAENPVTAPEVQSQSVALPEAQTAIATPDASVTPVQTPAAPKMPEEAPVSVEREAAGLPDTKLADTPPSIDAELPPAPEVGTAQAVETEVQTPPSAEVGPAETAPEAEVAQAQTPKADIVPAPVPSAPASAAPDSGQAVAELAPVDRPAPGFGGKVEGVKTGRLPSIGAAPAPEVEAPIVAAADEAAAEDDASLPPVERFARPFDNAAAKPLFAILLQDTGGPTIDRDALAAIPFPVSFVIDPSQPDAAAAAKIYRAAGQEVLMLASGIPEGATASDLEISLEGMSAVLPEAVAVVDLESGGFQGNRILATQVLAIVKDQGRGVLSWDRGLNAASQVARREGIRNAVIFRALDADGESSAVIRRYLDRAAFKAAQDGRVVVWGTTRPETVAALLEWAVEGRAATVAIAPSTAVMTAQ